MYDPHVSARGRDFIAQEEGGHQLKAYKCQAGVWTIGVGHTGPEVKEGMTISRAESERLFALDLVRFEKAVALATQPRALHQHEFDAMVSLAFNIGAKAFTDSTLAKAVRGGDMYAAARQFTVWNKAGGMVSPGLLARRTRELLMFVGLEPNGD